MVSYIGTPTSRVDGRAKVTGAAKYAADFNVPGLIYGNVVSSRIAKGRVRRIDATEALSVTGVVEVLTHTNRPAMARSDQDYKDDVAPDGSPFRPLYDDKVLFSGQPIALVLAQEPEIARFTSARVLTRSWPRSPPICLAFRSTISRSSSATRRCHNHRSRAGRGWLRRWPMRSRRPPMRSVRSFGVWRTSSGGARWRARNLKMWSCARARSSTSRIHIAP